MRKAFELFSMVGMVVCAKSPFVGDARHVDHGDGRHSIKMNSVKT